MWTHSSGDDQFHPIGTGPVLIQGVGTSTAGFVGQSERGPATPRLVTGWADYERWFGGPVDSSLSSLPWAVGFASARLHGGDDGPNPATVADYQGNTTAGLSALEAVEEIALLLQCERRKDRFAVLQERDGQSNPQTIRVDRASRYGATYWPWIRAPANQVVRGIVTGDSPGDLGPLEARGDQGSPGHPRPQGVNVIRDFRAAGHGIRVWGPAPSPATRSGATSTWYGWSSSSRRRSTRGPGGRSSNPTTRRPGPGCLLRSLRPHHHDPGRHRQRAPGLPGRRRSGDADRARPPPHPPQRAARPNGEAMITWSSDELTRIGTVRERYDSVA